MTNTCECCIDSAAMRMGPAISLNSRLTAHGNKLPRGFLVQACCLELYSILTAAVRRLHLNLELSTETTGPAWHAEVGLRSGRDDNLDGRAALLGPVRA